MEFTLIRKSPLTPLFQRGDRGGQNMMAAGKESIGLYEKIHNSIHFEIAQNQILATHPPPPIHSHENRRKRLNDYALSLYHRKTG
jgi:hypothetical protein